MSLYMKKLKLHEVKPKTLGKSQKGQDAYINHIVENLGTTNKYYVEFGASNGNDDSNTYFLRTAKNWNGLLLEADSKQFPPNPSINLHNATLTMENSCEVFASHNVPKTFDFLSVDIDGNDYWILSKILENYNPRVIMVETCARFDPDVRMVQKYDPNFVWQGNRWIGGSPLAFKLLGKKHGYTAVYMHLDDMFLIKDSELHSSNLNPLWSTIYPHALPHLYQSHDKSTREKYLYQVLRKISEDIGLDGKSRGLYDSYHQCVLFELAKGINKELHLDRWWTCNINEDEWMTV